MGASIFSWLPKDNGVVIPSPEGAMLRVPKDTPEELWDQTLAVMRAARILLETKPQIKPYVPPGRAKISLTRIEH